MEREDSSGLSMTELSLLRNYWALALSSALHFQSFATSKLSLMPQKIKRPGKEVNGVGFFQEVLSLVDWVSGCTKCTQ